MTPASIRYNNPGAQYPGTSARQFGSLATETIGGGHRIAVFDDPVKGAAAQFDLLARGYAGLPLSHAIAKWSGGNSTAAYLANIQRATGLTPDTVLTPQLLSDPAVAVPLAKAMAQHEAGRPYPLSDDQWRQAHALARGGGPPTDVKRKDFAQSAQPAQPTQSQGAPMGPDPKSFRAAQEAGMGTDQMDFTTLLAKLFPDDKQGGGGGPKRDPNKELADQAMRDLDDGSLLPKPKLNFNRLRLALGKPFEGLGG